MRTKAMKTSAVPRSSVRRSQAVPIVDAVLVVLIIFTAVSSVLTQPFWDLSIRSESVSTQAPLERLVTIDGEPISLDAVEERLRDSEGTFLITVTAQSARR